MNPITDLLTAIDKLITEHGSATILKERIVQLREELERLFKENDRLQKELDAANNETSQLKTALEQKTIPNEYFEYRGVLFRRLPNGDIQYEVYCPACKIYPMSIDEDFVPFVCSKCGFRTSFKGRDLKRIIAEIV